MFTVVLLTVIPPLETVGIGVQSKTRDLSTFYTLFSHNKYPSIYYTLAGN
jgi:hypothetical protein